MRFRPAVLIPLLAVVGVGLWHGRSWDSPETSAATDARPAVSAFAVPARALQLPPAERRVVEFLQPTPAAEPLPPCVVTAEITADDAALVAETGTLQLLARDTQLELTTRQWSAFAAVTLEFQAVRLAYEASLARPAAARDGASRLEIPAYPAAGDRLREKFQAALVVALGPENAAEIQRELGGKLEGYFAGFGVGVQTLEFAGEPARAGEFQVLRTVHYWNSVDGAAALSFRRETYFPALEDPSGVTWGPLLARLAHSAGGGTGG